MSEELIEETSCSDFGDLELQFCSIDHDHSTVSHSIRFQGNPSEGISEITISENTYIRNETADPIRFIHWLSVQGTSDQISRKAYGLTDLLGLEVVLVPAASVLLEGHAQIGSIVEVIFFCIAFQ